MIVGDSCADMSCPLAPDFVSLRSSEYLKHVPSTHIMFARLPAGADADADAFAFEPNQEYLRPSSTTPLHPSYPLPRNEFLLSTIHIRSD